MIWNQKQPTAKPKKSVDLLVLILTLVLSLLGLLIITDASAVVAQTNFGDQFYYLKRQVAWLILGLSIMFLLSNIDYQQFRRASKWLLLTSLITLVLVLIPSIGESRLGARRWLGVGNQGFQPSELAKLALIVWGADFFAQILTPLKRKLVTINEKINARQSNLQPIWPFLAILLIMAGLIMLEPDLGTTIVLVAVGLSLSFLAETPANKILLFLILGLVIGLALIIFSPYRQERLLTFLDPHRDPQGSSYHTQQILIALGSGGLFGQGISQSKQKYAYLPEVVTDSIFAVVGEELGFVGALFLISLLAVLVLACFRLALKAPDRFGQLICGGVGTLIAIQTIINLGAIVGIFPLTGIPLPLISYGGSSLVVTLTGLGMVLSISRCKIEERRGK